MVVQEFGPITGGAETILVVEDDARVRETVIETLNDLGYRVLQASEPQAALSVIESGIPIDMLFTDVVMPGRIKSAELARMASERLPGLKVLFTSGYSENSIVHGGRLNQGVELLSKPYTREALARKVRLLLSAGGAKVQEPAPAAILVQQAGEATGLTLLLCEDDTLICMATTEMLEDLGHKVIAVGTAALALATLAANPVDVLITDVGLPDMSAAKLVELARSQWPDLAVIFATGHFAVDGFPPDDKTGILIKPYDSILLAGAIAKVAGG